jgi:hypothetical protein
MGYGLFCRILHKVVVTFDVGYQFVNFGSLGGRFVHLTVALKRVSSKEAQAIAENVEIVLVICLAFAK